MTVDGLNKLLQPAASKCDFFGAFNHIMVGVDMFFWLHQIVSTPGTAQKLLAGELPPDECPVLRIIRQRLRRMQMEGLGCVCIFDGEAYPAKGKEDTRRTESLVRAYTRVNETIAREGLAGVKNKDAILLANDVRKHVNRVIVHVLIPLGVAYWVGRYEADHMLALLDELDVIQLVLATDQDMKVLKIRRIIGNMNWQTGVGELWDATYMKYFGACKTEVERKVRAFLGATEQVTHRKYFLRDLLAEKLPSLEDELVPPVGLEFLAVQTIITSSTHDVQSDMMFLAAFMGNFGVPLIAGRDDLSHLY